MPDTGDHYFSTTPDVASSERTVRMSLGTLNAELISDAGVFSSSRLDAGTEIFLKEVPAPTPSSTVLDLGCGYGPIAVWCASVEPTCEVWAVDVNERAVELCKRNADALKLNITAATPDGIDTDIKFDFIYSNPPARIGKTELHDLLMKWFERLQPDGTAYLVVQKHLGSDSLSKWLQHQGFKTKKLASKRAYRVIEVTRG